MDMSGGLLSPTTCGFAKIAGLHAAKFARSTKQQRKSSWGSPKSLELKAGHEIYCDILKDDQESYAIDMQTFNKRFPALRIAVNKWHMKKKAEETYFKTFSVESWNKHPY